MINDPSLRHFPLPMLRFGVNHLGTPLYRIVFAPTRRYLVCGAWQDGSTKALWCKKHGPLGDRWIMERWLAAEEYAKCSKETWDATMAVLGTWPVDGEYELCHVFVLTPDNMNIEKVIKWVEAGRQVRLYDSVQFSRDQAAKDEADQDSVLDSFIRNKCRYLANQPMVGYGGHRGSKTEKDFKSAEHFGLPTTPGQLRTRSRGPKIEVPVHI